MHRISGNELIKEISLTDIEKACGNEITFCACVQKIKNSGSFHFVMLRTGRYVLQAIYQPNVCTGDFETLCEGAYITVTGRVKEERRAELGYELELSSFDIISIPQANYPIPISDKHLVCSLETGLENRTTMLRHPDARAVFKIFEGFINGCREFLQKERFTEIHTPKISDCGDGFRLKYFGNDAVLAEDTWQYQEACIAFFDRVFEISSAYSAKKRNSTRHLNEYTELAVQMGFINGINDIMQIETAMLKHAMAYLIKNYSYEIHLLDATIPEITDIPVMTFTEALDILGKPQTQKDLDPTDEAKLCEYAENNLNSDFIFVTNFPECKRPSYTKESFDLLFKGVNITDGLESNHNCDKYGMPPHGGFRIGIERFITKLLKLENIRLASIFPRDLHNLNM